MLRKIVKTDQKIAEIRRFVWDQSEKFYAPNTAWPKLSQSFLKLPERYNFDLAVLNQKVSEVLQTHPLKAMQEPLNSNRQREVYKGIGFRSRPTSEDKIYDAFGVFDPDGKTIASKFYFREKDSDQISLTLKMKERNFRDDNELMFPELRAILDNFKSSIGKVRLISLGAGARLKPHIDFPYYEQIRIHTVLKTNPDVWWEVGDQEFQIPADGSFYWYDTGIPHAIRNDGNTDRLILSLHLSPYFDENGHVHVPMGSDLIQILRSGEV